MIAAARSSTAGKVGGLPLDVVVRSRHLLVAQAVGAALCRREVDARVEPWDLGEPERKLAGDVVLLIDELDSRVALDAVRTAAAQSTAPVLVLTSRPSGATWGGVLEAGASAVLSSDASLDVVEDAIDSIRAGRPLMSEGDKARLVDTWLRWQVEVRDLERRLDTLSARETSVLGLLVQGRRVVDIAELLGVSESTVRSQVKSLRRKLGVESQLAAVAVVQRLTRGPGDDGPVVPRPRTEPRG